MDPRSVGLKHIAAAESSWGPCGSTAIVGSALQRLQSLNGQAEGLSGEVPISASRAPSRYCRDRPRFRWHFCHGADYYIVRHQFPQDAVDNGGRLTYVRLPPKIHRRSEMTTSHRIAIALAAIAALAVPQRTDAQLRGMIGKKITEKV